ncbi:acyl-CoA thioesterase [Phaeacidiphilus oryzae]|uniref:acyl-CoA thioesterase n=1 Tax=Phaeacidiphilus oryzae TaxID=348818 RepID=UPI000560108A
MADGAHLRHRYACPLRWSDMDAFRHVNNVNFLRYLEEARIDFMWTQASNAGVRDLSRGTVVARHEIDYLRPLVHRAAPVTVETWLTKLANASFTVAYEIKDVHEDGTETLYVRASTKCVPYDLDAGRPRRMSQGEREFLAPYLEAPVAAV